MRKIIAPALAVGALSLAACGGERTAEVETATAEAEVSTELPEEMISDEELEDLASQAAAGAGSATVPTDPAASATGGVQTQTGVAGAGQTGSTTSGSPPPPAQ